MMFLTAIAVATAMEPEPLTRVCVESMETHHASHVTMKSAFPYVDLSWVPTHTARVRALPTRDPSWMWGRPLQPIHNTPIHFTIVTTGDITPGAVLYVDARAVNGSDRVELSPDQHLTHVLGFYDDQYELELCPEARQALASR